MTDANGACVVSSQQGWHELMVYSDMVNSDEAKGSTPVQANRTKQKADLGAGSRKCGTFLNLGSFPLEN